MEGIPDFYSQVPKTLEENLDYRLKLRRRAATDKRFRQACLAASRHDILFWLNAFVYLYEPRPRFVNGRQLPMVIPFITWPHQDKFILTVKEYLGKEDIGVEKSRGEGASWIGTMFALHDWLFKPMAAIGLVSRTEEAADDPEDPDSLFWKIDWELEQLPKWMVPPKKRKLAEHTLRNLDNNATIVAYSATGDVASGGRKMWFLMDELAKFPRGPDADAMASTQFVTDSRLVVSTPKGSEGEYYRMMHEPSSLVKVVLDWKDNPTRRLGLYQFVDGKPKALEAGNSLPKHYDPPSKEVLDLFSRLRKRGYKLEGTIRSPWYDHECDRTRATPQKIAQELDRDYGGSAFHVLGEGFREEALKGVRPPFLRGILSFHPETLEPDFDRSNDGEAKLWVNLDARGRPPRGTYVASADICTGLGGTHTSNSVLTVFDMGTGAQVFEFAVNTMPPEDFADYSMAASKWFGGAFLSWEINGPGSAFTKRVLDKKYGNLYYRKVLWKRSKRQPKREPGWWTDGRTKEALFSELSRSVKAGEIVLRSRELVEECGQYVRSKGKIVHEQLANATDDAAGEAHGDRVIAAGVAIMAMRDRPALIRQEKKKRDLTHTPAGRLKEYEDSLWSQLDSWDNRTNWDMMNTVTGFTDTVSVG